MKFTVSLNELHNMLTKTLPAIPQKSTVPVLEHLNFKLENGKLQIIGTNQDITIMTTLTVDSEDNGAVLVPAKRFEAFVKTLGNKGELEITIDPENYEIILNTTSGSFKMKGLDPDEYLDLPELFQSKKPSDSYVNEDGTIDVSIPGVKILKDDLIRITNKTVFAVSDDDFRPAMTGVLFRFTENSLIAVSTDGYRLVKANTTIEDNPFTEGLDVIIPSKTADFLKKIDDDVVFSIIEGDSEISKIRFDIGEDTVLISKVIKEKFPPFESVIPDNNEFSAYIESKSLLGAIKRVALFSNKVSKQVKMYFEKDSLSIQAVDEDSGNSGKEHMNCEYSFDPIQLGFNYKYIEEALLNIDPKDTTDDMILMTFSEPSKPVLIMPKSDKDELLMLIMPIRV